MHSIYSLVFAFCIPVLLAPQCGRVTETQSARSLPQETNTDTKPEQSTAAVSSESESAEAGAASEPEAPIEFEEPVPEPVDDTPVEDINYSGEDILEKE